MLDQAPLQLQAPWRPTLACVLALSLACSSTSKVNVADASGGANTDAAGPDGSGTGGGDGAAAGRGGASGTQGTSGGTAGASSDGSAGDAGGEAGGASSDASPGDASSDMAAPDACVTPRPTAVFDPSPPGGDGISCNRDRALGVSDSLFAGLDCRAGGLAAVQLGGQTVCGCLGVDFGVEQHLDPVFVRARSSPSACGTACGGARCNTGHDLLVFEGQPGAYRYLQTIRNIPPVPGDYPLTLLGRRARYLVFCRFAYSPDRDDIEIDSIYSKACE
jgi:hypothetical protein